MRERDSTFVFFIWWHWLAFFVYNEDSLMLFGQTANTKAMDRAMRTLNTLEQECYDIPTYMVANKPSNMLHHYITHAGLRGPFSLKAPSHGHKKIYFFISEHTNMRSRTVRTTMDQERLPSPTEPSLEYTKSYHLNIVSRRGHGSSNRSEAHWE